MYRYASEDEIIYQEEVLNRIISDISTSLELTKVDLDKAIFTLKNELALYIHKGQHLFSDFDLKNFEKTITDKKEYFQNIKGDWIIEMNSFLKTMKEQINTYGRINQPRTIQFLEQDTHALDYILKSFKENLKTKELTSEQKAKLQKLVQKFYGTHSPQYFAFLYNFLNHTEQHFKFPEITQEQYVYSIERIRLPEQPPAINVSQFHSKTIEKSVEGYILKINEQAQRMPGITKKIINLSRKKIKIFSMENATHYVNNIIISLSDLIKNYPSAIFKHINLNSPVILIEKLEKFLKTNQQKSTKDKK